MKTTIHALSAITALGSAGILPRSGPSDRKLARLGRQREYNAKVRAKVGPEATAKRLAGIGK